MRTARVIISLIDKLGFADRLWRTIRKEGKKCDLGPRRQRQRVKEEVWRFGSA